MKRIVGNALATATGLRAAAAVGRVAAAGWNEVFDGPPPGVAPSSRPAG